MNTKIMTVKRAKEKSYAVDVLHTSEIINHQGHMEQFRQWRQVGIVQATRAGTAIRAAERQMPRRMIRVRLLTTCFTWRTFEPSVRTMPLAVGDVAANLVADLAEVMKFSKGAA